MESSSIVYRPTQLIAEEFQRADIKFTVLFNDEHKAEILKCCISIIGGPRADVCFISNDNKNDVIIRIGGLITAVTDEKRASLLAAFNEIHLETPYCTFSLAKNGDINVGTILSEFISDECLGKSALVILVRLNQILNQKYSIIAKALYSDPIRSTANTPQDK